MANNMINNKYSVGVDVGSTTVKVVVYDGDRQIYGAYQRHRAQVREALISLLTAACDTVDKSAPVCVAFTGSGSINLAKHVGVPFVQEVAADAEALKRTAPGTDVAIELGGEDAKIIYFTGGLEERMNGVCAGGTGSFIDQMASLLQTDATGLNEYAKGYKQLYPIAARCGVFAKSDIQPLINDGVAREDLAASIMQAVVNQTISGLACGKPIKGKVAFLGGPLHFLSSLREAFIRTLNLTPENTVIPESPHLFAASGAAMLAKSEATSLSELIRKLEDCKNMAFELKRLDPLFNNEKEYEEFRARHDKAKAKRGELSSYSGNCFLGIDAGSTTTKLALIGEDGELLWSHYSSNNSSPITVAKAALSDMYSKLPVGAKIARTCSTGYGEELMKSAFCLDEGQVETVAHCTAAMFFDPEADCVLDIGGQDMKYIKLKNGAVDNVLLNEACSSGCGSFIENFAQSLGHTAATFATEALFAQAPADLGTRCTVFMNSNVKQAQKEGATVADISSGLAYSVVKNALFKVIKLADASALGKHVIVQGGTFRSNAVLRAFEKISGVEAICPDISELMGAFGAALIAKDTFECTPSTFISKEDLESLTFTTSCVRCGKCSNNCLLTVNKFSGNRRYISGNRCENGIGQEKKNTDVPDVLSYKYKRVCDYEPLAPENAPMGEIGIPRVLNMYENYPFWAVFFKSLGFRVILSPESSREIYQCGMDSIPSESECYPAKLSHGHVQALINQGVKTIFYPSIFFERYEDGASKNYNCPMVIGYPENINNNVEDITSGKVRFIHPFISFESEKIAAQRLCEIMKNSFDLPAKAVKQAVAAGWAELLKFKQDIKKAGAEALEWIEKHNGHGIVVAGRPYHCDPEINHGIPGLINSYGLAVLTEDCLPGKAERPIRVTDQWSYHSRLYTAAQFVRTRTDLDLLQLNSFGCGLDAVTADQISELLESAGKLYTLLKIDEISNLGAARIRIRSLIAAIGQRNGKKPKNTPATYNRVVFTEQMKNDGYTILAPQMAPIHFELVQAAFKKFGYNLVILDNDTRSAVDTGLKSVNNDACYPSLIVTGQLLNAVTSGKYDTDKLAIIMSQTGGCCRASNYIAFIRRALEKAGYPHIPVISLNFGEMEQNPGFKMSIPMVLTAGRILVWGDLLMKCLYRTRPYEVKKGSANALFRKLMDEAKEMLKSDISGADHKRMCKKIVSEFDVLPITDEKKPRVGIVGEILVKYMPLANNYLVELLESEGAEAVVPDFIDFFQYSGYDSIYRSHNLGGKSSAALKGRLIIEAIEAVKHQGEKALAESKRFHPHARIEELAEMAKPFLSLGNQYGEGWFLTGEMIHLIKEGVKNIVCIQPFGCLPNHVVGKGVIKAIKKTYPEANIAAVDYDPGASEVNQLNRIKLLLSND